LVGLRSFEKKREKVKPLLTEELRKRIEPLLLPESPKPTGGRPRVPNRLVLTGILFVARTGCAWELLPP